jgi:drug/metabolite transporter (DMT)-like permease
MLVRVARGLACDALKLTQDGETIWPSPGSYCWIPRLFIPCLLAFGCSQRFRTDTALGWPYSQSGERAWPQSHCYMGIHFWPVTAVQPKDAGPTQSEMATVGAYTLTVLCWLLSAGVYIAAKAVATEMPPWTLCFWRVVIAGLILLPTARPHWSAIVSIVRQRWLALLVIGGIGLAITQGLMYTGLNYTSAINAGLILALMPVITMILARFLLNEVVGPWQIVGSIVACIGMAIIVVRGDLSALLRLDLNAGELFVVAAALLFALYTVLLGKANFQLARLPLLVVLLGGGAVAALPFYIWELAHDERTSLNAKGILALAYVAGPGGALMYYLFNRSVQTLGASRAGVFLYLQTIFVAVLAYFFLGERLLPYHLIGAGFILVGVLLVMLLKPHRRSAEPAS